MESDGFRAYNPELTDCMPTVLRSGPYRFFFYAGDRDEPNVHVERDEKTAKFWLSPIRLQSSGGFSRTELSRIETMVRNHRKALMEAWDEYFGKAD